MKNNELRLPALEVRQSTRRVLYSFAIDGKLLPKVATVSRIARDQNHRILGYQRPEILSHIVEIRNYLESDNPMIPNAIVVAFDGRVRFEPLDATGGLGFSRPGLLVIPIEEGQPDALKPGWIVDGQQRSAAIREARLSHFPVCVVGFIA
jgi:DGQHR domain-containing protein